MAPLDYNQKHMEIFGFCARQRHQNGSSAYVTFATRFLMLFIIFGMAWGPSTVYFYLHSGDTDTFVSALTLIVAYFLVFASYLTFFCQDKVAINTFANICELLNQRECILVYGKSLLVFEGMKTELNNAYSRAEEKSIIITKWPV